MMYDRRPTIHRSTNRHEGHGEATLASNSMLPYDVSVLTLLLWYTISEISFFWICSLAITHEKQTNTHTLSYLWGEGWSQRILDNSARPLDLGQRLNPFQVDNLRGVVPRVDAHTLRLRLLHLLLLRVLFGLNVWDLLLEQGLGLGSRLWDGRWIRLDFLLLCFDFIFIIKAKHFRIIVLENLYLFCIFDCYFNTKVLNYQYGFCQSVNPSEAVNLLRMICLLWYLKVNSTLILSWLTRSWRVRRAASAVPSFVSSLTPKSFHSLILHSLQSNILIHITSFVDYLVMKSFILRLCKLGYPPVLATVRYWNWREFFNQLCPWREYK